MASVFLSYDREDTARAAEIAAALENSSHSVWWDHQIRGGAQYSKEIERALDEADAVVVLWSKASVDSAWVRDEAAEGRDRGKLVPVSIDSARPPIGFRQFQTIDLSKPRGRKPKDGINQLLATVGNAAPGVAPTPQRAASGHENKNGARKWPIAAAAVATVAVVGTLLAVRPFPPAAAEEISAAVVPLDGSPQSKSLSNDLTAKLGRYSPENGAQLRLMAPGQQSRAAFVFQVGSSASAGRLTANLLLLDGRSSAVLWSGQFDRPTGAAGDLQQEMGYTASQVLGCALQAYQSKQVAAKLDLLKSFLNGCAAAASENPPDATQLVQQFRRIVEAVPAFEGGWAQLLSAESVAATDSNARRQLSRDIAKARKLDPDLPELFLAELMLVPEDEYAGQIATLDRGLAKNPGNALLLSLRSIYLLGIGRANEAVADGKQAVDADPTSPSIRTQYVYTLATAGRTQAAFNELDAAERFWPGSSDLARQRYILNSRYGDARIAAAYVQSSAYEGDPQHALLYLEARMNPTAGNVERALRDAREGYATRPEGIVGLMQALGMFGRQKELLELVMTMPRAQGVIFRDILFRPTMRTLWLDPRSLIFAKRIGLLQYWSSSGKWPDFCFAPDLSYDCKKEAAKLAA